MRRVHGGGGSFGDGLGQMGGSNNVGAATKSVVVCVCVISSFPFKKPTHKGYTQTQTCPNGGQLRVGPGVEQMVPNDVYESTG